MSDRKKIELLAPARDYDTACAAIDHGADAVYMGVSRFGARRAAGNTVEDIAKVVNYAKPFGVRVYTTLNTLLFEDELKDAERNARDVISAGVDALIVQDMAYMEMGLEGVEMHASTQTFNADPEKVKFLSDVGFSRVVLERNLSLNEIRSISRTSDVELECFVHGAICVCYSGRCYMSRTLSSRSGNRGDCMQACRLPYDLMDDRGDVIITNKHLLSIKDFDLSDRLGDLLDAGVTSFKIEGRLKDEAYVKNVVSWYRLRLDEELRKRPHMKKWSAGQSLAGFTPDIEKTFSRSRTEYFFDGRRREVSTPDTPKAVGEFMGTVGKVGKGWFEIDSGESISAGDGVCFMLDDGLQGTNVNKAEGRRIYTNKELPVKSGTEVYRNYDHRFNAVLENSRTKRVLDVRVVVKVSENGLTVSFEDDDGIQVQVSHVAGNGTAKEPLKMTETVKTQLSRSGDTVFRIKDVVLADVQGNIVSPAEIMSMPFVRVSELNALRREGLDALLSKRMAVPRNLNIKKPCGNGFWPERNIDGSENVTNSLARRFYQRHGAVLIEEGYDLRQDMKGVRVMRTAFCVRRENGLCDKGKAKPMKLRHGMHVYGLEFDCGDCAMDIIYEGKNTDRYE